MSESKIINELQFSNINTGDTSLGSIGKINANFKKIKDFQQSSDMADILYKILDTAYPIGTIFFTNEYGKFPQNISSGTLLAWDLLDPGNTFIQKCDGIKDLVGENEVKLTSETSSRRGVRSGWTLNTVNNPHTHSIYVPQSFQTLGPFCFQIVNKTSEYVSVKKVFGGGDDYLKSWKDGGITATDIAYTLLNTNEKDLNGKTADGNNGEDVKLHYKRQETTATEWPSGYSHSHKIESSDAESSHENRLPFMTVYAYKRTR